MAKRRIAKRKHISGPRHKAIAEYGFAEFNAGYALGQRDVAYDNLQHLENKLAVEQKKALAAQHTLLAS